MPPQIKPVDQQARDEIHEVRARVESHEKICAEIRQQEQIWRTETRELFARAIADLKETQFRATQDLRDALREHAKFDEAVAQKHEESLASYVKPLYGRFWSLLIGLCVGLFGVIGFLVPKAFHMG